MKTQTEKFIEELEKINKKNYEEFILSIDHIDFKIYNVTFETKISDELMSEFNLNSDITMACQVNPTRGKMIYYYKELEIEPDSYYIMPEGYTIPTILEILQEAIKQDTHQPNIKK